MTCEHGQLPLAVALQDPVELLEPLPPDSGHLVCVHQLSVHILPQLPEGHYGLVGCRDGRLDDLVEVLALGQRLHGAGSELPGPHQRAAPQAQLAREDLGGLPGAHVSAQPQRHPLELLQVGQQDGREAADSTRQRHAGQPRGLAHGQGVQLLTRQHHLCVGAAHQRQAEQVEVGAAPRERGLVVGDFVAIHALGGQKLQALQRGVRPTKPGEDQTLGGLEEPHAKLLQSGVRDLGNLEQNIKSEENKMLYLIQLSSTINCINILFFASCVNFIIAAAVYYLNNYCFYHYC